MYKFIDNNSATNHDIFVSNHEMCNLLQSANWSKVKNNWNHAYTAVYCDDEIKAAAMVLIKPLPLGYCMMYIPRGPIMDYQDKELVAFMFSSLKQWAKRKKCLFISFDPSIIARQFTLDDKEKAYDSTSLEIIETIKNNGGALFKGFTKNIHDTIQPRFHMGVYYSDDWKEKFPKSTMKSIRKATNKHVMIEEIGFDQIDEFARIMHLTEERKNVHLRGKTYFEKLKQAYGDDAHLYLAKVNPSKRDQELQEAMKQLKDRMQDSKLKEKGIRKLQEDMRKIEEERASLQAVLKECPGEKIIACGLMIIYGNYAEMLYAGMDEEYRAFRSQYLIYLEQFEYAFAHGCKFVTMGGVEGSLDDGLSVFKSNFNPTVVEYIGEFDLPVKKVLYKLAKTMQKLRTGK